MEAVKVPQHLELNDVIAFGLGAARLHGGALRAVLECPTLAFRIKGEAEQRAIVDGWAALLNSLSYPLQILIRARALDPGRLATLPKRSEGDHAALRDSYRCLLD